MSIPRLNMLEAFINGQFPTLEELHTSTIDELQSYTDTAKKHLDQGAQILDETRGKIKKDEEVATTNLQITLSNLHQIQTRAQEIQQSSQAMKKKLHETAQALGDPL